MARPYSLELSERVATQVAQQCQAIERSAERGVLKPQGLLAVGQYHLSQGDRLDLPR